MRITASYNNRVWKGKSDYYDEKGSPEDCEEISVRSRAVAEGKDSAIFYVGKRRQKIEITQETKEVCKIIEEISKRETNEDVLCMIDGIKKGRCDVAIIHDVHWEKNAYYDKKRKFIEKVYKCCIKLQLVDYEEIINEEIV